MEANKSLKELNTFGIQANAKHFVQANNEDQVRWAIQSDEFRTNPNLILGGGSNVLFTKDFDGIVIKNNIKGIEVIENNNDYVKVRVGGGEIWHNFVLYAINNGWGGIENLSLIPGSVGASPMQNIGAYGVEIKEVFEELEAINLRTGEIKYFNNSDCKFGYRESVFKNECKNQYLISRVTYKLSKQPKFNTSYGAIEQELERMGIQDLSLKAISDAVINIRSSKLPDPKEIGNAGSFFKNPVVATTQYETLKAQFPNLVGYTVNDQETKLAAGWLIDQAGWKGKTINKHGVHKNQALVLVNYGGATGDQVFDLSEQIINSVKEQFGVQLNREVNIY